MAFSQVRYVVADGVATITLNRPDRLNAFTGTMSEEIYGAFQQAVADSEVKAIIMTGAGDGFCAGIDMKSLADDAERQMIADGAFLRRFPLEVDACPKPTICAFNGPAVGIGVTMTLAFDYRLASSTARLSVPFAKLGLLPGMGSSHLLPKLVGRSRSREILMTARMMSAAEAMEIGLVDEVVAPEDLMPAAQRKAETIAAWDPVVVSSIKQLLMDSSAATLADAMDQERIASAALSARLTEKAVHGRARP